MILFKTDFLKYPNAIIDTTTSNKSFMELAAKYHASGVKNAGMILTLLDPTLKGVDPFSDNLTRDQKKRIAVEAANNIWYWLRELCRIPPSAGVEPIRFKANRGNIAIAWLASLDTDFILIQPRQTGKSVGVDCLMVRLLYLATFSTKISMITKDNALRTANIERLKAIRDLLPSYLIVKDKSDSDNKTGLTYNIKKCQYVAAVGQMSEAASRNVGRGQTSPIFQIDEGPFIPNLDVMVPSALAAGTAAKEQARLENQPNFTAFTTTAGKQDDRSGGYMYKLVSDSITWSETFFDLKNKAEFDLVVRKGCRNLAKRVYCCFSHTQLGKSDLWLRQALSETGAIGEEADRDFFNRWTSGSLSSPLSVEHNTIIKNSIKQPQFTEISKEGYQIKWYLKADKVYERMAEGNVIISMDTSEAVGNDDIGVTFTDMNNLSTIGAATINETNLLMFGTWVGNTLLTYEKLVLMIEKKSTGQSIIDVVTSILMAAGHNPFKRIYNTVVQESDTRESDYREITSGVMTKELVNKYRKFFGFITSAQSRHFLYSNTIQNNAKLGGSRVNDETLVNQITSLVTKNGRIDHSHGNHDDMVIAWLLAGWMAANGRNLGFYGLAPEKCLSETITVVQETPKQAWERKEQEKITETIKEVHGRLIASKSKVEIITLEAKLRGLVNRTKETLGDSMNIDSMLLSAEKQRQLNNIGKRSNSTNDRVRGRRVYVAH